MVKCFPEMKSFAPRWCNYFVWHGSEKIRLGEYRLVYRIDIINLVVFISSLSNPPAWSHFDRTLRKEIRKLVITKKQLQLLLVYAAIGKVSNQEKRGMGWAGIEGLTTSSDNFVFWLPVWDKIEVLNHTHNAEKSTIKQLWVRSLAFARVHSHVPDCPQSRICTFAHLHARNRGKIEFQWKSTNCINYTFLKFNISVQALEK